MYEICATTNKQLGKENGIPSERYEKTRRAFLN